MDSLEKSGEEDEGEERLAGHKKSIFIRGNSCRAILSSSVRNRVLLGRHKLYGRRIL